MDYKLAFNVSEMAKALGISMPVAYELCRRKDFPAIKVSERRIIIPTEALAKWLDENGGNL